MNGIFHIGATGLQAQQSALHVIANNLTNMNTPGFRRSEVRFSELVAPLADLGVPTNDLTARIASLLGVSAQAAPRLDAQGELRATGDPLDVAIRGEGFIELLGPRGQTLLWRGGRLRIDDEGNLVAANGLQLKAAITVPDGAQSITIDATGRVHAIVAGGGEPQELGQIELVRVRDASTLEVAESGIYIPADDADLRAFEASEEGGAIVQGSIELSNVEMTTEMVMLMMTQRAYAASAQLVQAGDQLMGIVNSLRR